MLKLKHRSILQMRMILCAFFILTPIYGAYGKYQEPEYRTQLNKQSNLFEKNIEGSKELESDLARMMKDFGEGVGKGTKAVSEVSGKDENAMQGESERLSNIKALDLEDRGREEMIKSKFMEEMHIDENRPGFLQHKKDADRIADGQKKLMGNLGVELGKLGIECKQEKGNEVVEPEYYMDIERIDTRDRKYNKVICQELRNKYNCRQELKLRCIKRGIRWNPWINREIQMSGYDVYNQHSNWLKTMLWKRTKTRRRKFQYVLRGGIESQIKDEIVKRLKASPEQINVTSIGVGLGNLLDRWPDDYFRAFEIYKFPYQFREGTDICEEWSEEWIERCSIK